MWIRTRDSQSHEIQSQDLKEREEEVKMTEVSNRGDH